MLKPEIDFKDLLRRPEKLFGYSYLYFLGVLLLLGMLYVGNLNVIGKSAIQPVVLRDSSAFVQDIPLRSPINLPPVDVMKAAVASDSMIARGKEVYRANCSSCHGETGLGDGATAPTLNPRPRNFHSLEGWKNGSKVSAIYKTLQEGIAGGAMAAYDYMAPADRFSLAHFVRSLAAGQPVDSPQELQALETTYQLSKGSIQPGNIPVRKAMQYLLNDAAPKVDAIASQARMLMSESRDQGGQMLKRLVADPTRLLVSLHSRRAGFPTLNEFVYQTSLDPGVVGLKPEVTQLSDAEWAQVHASLKQLFVTLSAQ